jgi:hypothetical protein
MNERQVTNSRRSYRAAFLIVRIRSITIREKRIAKITGGGILLDQPRPGIPQSSPCFRGLAIRQSSSQVLSG